MSTIRLEHDQFAAAPALADVLTDRLLTVAPAAGELAWVRLDCCRTSA